MKLTQVKFSNGFCLSFEHCAVSSFLEGVAVIKAEVGEAPVLFPQQQWKDSEGQNS